jgi:hypothetical protein
VCVNVYIELMHCICVHPTDALKSRTCTHIHTFTEISFSSALLPLLVDEEDDDEEDDEDNDKEEEEEDNDEAGMSLLDAVRLTPRLNETLGNEAVASSASLVALGAATTLAPPKGAVELPSIPAASPSSTLRRLAPDGSLYLGIYIYIYIYMLCQGDVALLFAMVCLVESLQGSNIPRFRFPRR